MSVTAANVSATVPGSLPGTSRVVMGRPANLRRQISPAPSGSMTTTSGTPPPAGGKRNSRHNSLAASDLP